jgi:hypothetical protein
VNSPSSILILCEGLTEKLYFEILIDNMHINAVEIEILGKKGQHKALIRKCIEERKKYAEEYNIYEDDIEVWAVCDHDNMKIGYQDLFRYAQENGINLAFSCPQFETYLLQHFGYQKNRKSKKELEDDLNNCVLSHCGMKYSKSDLEWLDKMVDETPDKINEVIENANKFDTHTSKPFLTVQKLTERLVNLAR